MPMPYMGIGIPIGTADMGIIGTAMFMFMFVPTVHTDGRGGTGMSSLRRLLDPPPSDTKEPRRLLLPLIRCWARTSC